MKTRGSASGGVVSLEVEVTDFVQEFETLAQRFDHLLASLALLDGQIVFAEELLKVHIVVIQGSNKLALCHILSLVDKESHDGLGHHIVHALSHCVEV